MPSTPNTQTRIAAAAAVLILAIAGAIATAARTHQAQPTQPPTPIIIVNPTPAPTPANPLTPTPAHCRANAALPDLTCTPGDVLTPDTGKICQYGYSRSVRNVPFALKQAVYAEYGITSHTPGQYEVDHLISLELGGSNSIRNLWPEAAEPRPGFHEKDQVENYLHQLVCSGHMQLQAAQAQIAVNWLPIYTAMPQPQLLATQPPKPTP